jgi:hypothetical protein
MTPATAAGAAVPQNVLRHLISQSLPLDADQSARARTTPERNRAWWESPHGNESPTRSASFWGRPWLARPVIGLGHDGARTRRRCDFFEGLHLENDGRPEWRKVT